MKHIRVSSSLEQINGARPFHSFRIVLTLTLVALYMGFVGFRRIYVMIRTGAPVDYSDRRQERIQSVINMVFGHEKVMEDKKAGYLHVFSSMVF